MILSAILCLAVMAVLLMASGATGSNLAAGGVSGQLAGQGQLAATVYALLVTAGLAFVLMLVIPALVDWVSTRWAWRRLIAFQQAQEDENLDAAGLLYTLRSVPWLANRIEAYFRIVGLADPRTFPFNRTAFGAVSADPHLGPDSTVDQRLGLAVFRSFPLLLFALGVAGALALRQGGTDTGSGFSLAEAMPALVAAVLVGFAARLTFDALVAMRIRQAGQFSGEVEGLVHRQLPDPLGELTATIRANHRGLRDTLDSVLSRVESDLRLRVEELSAAAAVTHQPAPTSQLPPPADAVIAEPEAVADTRTDPRETGRVVGPLMPAALAQVIGEVNARQAAQTERLTITLTTLTDTMVELRERVTVALDAFLDGMQAHTQSTLQTLSDGAETTLAHLGEIIETNRSQLQASAESAEHIRHTWHEIIEVLVPTIERLVDLHAQLSRLVDGAGRSDFARATEQLTGMTEGHREALDTMMRVADRMRDVASTLSGAAVPGTLDEALRVGPTLPPLPPPTPAPALGLAEGSAVGVATPPQGLGQEIERLRHELAAMAADLPDLERLAGDDPSRRSSSS